jgi:cytochrome P450 family 6
MIVFWSLIAIITLIHLWFRKKFSFWESRGFLAIRGKIPFGSVGEMGFKVHRSFMLNKFYTKNKDKAPAFGIYFMTQPVLVPTDPELVKHILVKSSEGFIDRGFYHNEKDDPISANLVRTI